MIRPWWLPCLCALPLMIIAAVRWQRLHMDCRPNTSTTNLTAFEFILNLAQRRTRGLAYSVPVAAPEFFGCRGTERCRGTASAPEFRLEYRKICVLFTTN